ncbi:hypothetical protein ACB376_11100 [Klebsiella electrica]
MSKNQQLLTVGELLDQLKHYPRDTKISFSGLDFYRLKWRGENLVQIEFNQQVYRNAEGLVVVENLDQPE